MGFVRLYARSGVGVNFGGSCIFERHGFRTGLPCTSPKRLIPAVCSLAMQASHRRGVMQNSV